jgi:hypothetical protein
LRWVALESRDCDIGTNHAQVHLACLIVGAKSDASACVDCVDCGRGRWVVHLPARYGGRRLEGPRVEGRQTHMHQATSKPRCIGM